MTAVLAARLLVSVVLSAVLLAACGNGDDGASSTGTDDSAGEQAGEQAGEEPGEEARAEAAVLALADLPAGWRAQAEEDRPDHDTTWQALASCLETEDPGRTAVAAVTSPTFVSGVATQVTSSVAYLGSEEQVQAVAAAYTGEQFMACASEAFAGDVERNAPPGATVSDVEVAAFEFPDVGDAVAAHRVMARIDLGEVTVPLVMDVVTIFDGRAMSRMVFLNPGDPFPEELQRSLTEKVVGRA